MNMDVTVDNCQAVPDVINGRAVVAMVGLDTVRMGEEDFMYSADADGRGRTRTDANGKKN